MEPLKPQNWKPESGVGCNVARRAGVGMNPTFADLSDISTADGRKFAFQHLMDSDRLTRNLNDLRDVPEIPAEAWLAKSMEQIV